MEAQNNSFNAGYSCYEIRQDRNIEISETLTKYYDKVLVHGDEQIITLEETFPLSHEITHLVEYTGYVLNPSISDSKETVGSGEVVVSLGGGAVGSDTLTKLFKIRRENLMDDTPWRFIVGPHMPEETLHEVKRSPIKNTIVERMRPDLPSLISRARLSISQAGYNTSQKYCPVIHLRFLFHSRVGTRPNNA